MGAIRFFLALSVVNVHGNNLLGFPLLMGDLSVQGFFIISGFYMALVLHEKYQPGKATYFSFISNRFLRIFPSYFIVLFLNILMLLVGGWYYGHSMGPFGLWFNYWAHIDWYAKIFLTLSHLALFGQDIYYFIGLDRLGGLYFDSNWEAHHNGFFQFSLMPQTWSMSLELCFYLVAPFLVRRSVAMIALMIATSLIIRFVLEFWLGWKSDPWSYRFFPSEIALFLCGAMAYRVYRVVRTDEMKAKNWAGLGALGVAAAAALLISRYPGGVGMWLNVGFVVAMLLVMPFLFKITQRSKIDNYIGELSYPMYLCHTLVIWLFVLFQIQNGLEKSVGVLLMTLLLSIVLYWYVDRKVDNFRHRKFSVASQGK